MSVVVDVTVVETVVDVLEAAEIVVDVEQNGLDGHGLPLGGTTGQIPAKASDADWDFEYIDLGAVSGAVITVNAKPGPDVVLTASDVGADASGAAAAAQAASDPVGAAAAAQSASQPVDSDLSAIAALATTPFGRNLLALADAAAGRTALGLGTAATAATGAFDAAGAAASAQAASQPVDSDLTAIALLATTSFGRNLLTLADAAAVRSALSLGSAAQSSSTAFQAADPDLTAIAALATAPFGRSLLTAADAAAVRTAIGVGSGTGDMVGANNLTELTNLTTARTNLGLGTAATQASSAFDTTGAAAAAQVAAATDATTKADAKVVQTITNGVTATAPSQDAVFDALALKQAALGYTAENVANKGTANGYAGLDGSGTVPSAQLPSFVDDVIEAANFAALPGTGVTGKIYVTLDNNLTYRWSGSVYVEISASLALGSTSSTAQRGDQGATAYTHSQLTSGNPHAVTKTDVGLANVDNTSNATERAATATLTNKTLTSPVVNTPTGIVKGDVGLGNVTNTSDANKPVSTAQAAADAVVQAASQPLDSDLTTIAGLTAATDSIMQAKAGAWSARTLAQLLTDLNLGAVYQALDSDLTTLAGLTATTGNFIVSVASAWASQTPTQAKAALAIANTDVSGLGTASTHAHTEYQLIDSDLTTIAGLTATTDNFIVSVASAWASRTPAQVKSTLAIANTDVSGLGTMSTQAANSVAITGGTVTGITDVAVADGGTGSSTAAAAAAALSVIPIDGWISDTAAWTRTANTTFTLVGDQTARFPKGTKIKYTDTTVKYGVVGSAVFSSVTTVTLISTSDYLMTANPSATFYSPVGVPQGWPGWFNWTATIVGFSANPTNLVHRWKADGNTIVLHISHVTLGTSNATTYTVSLPIAAASIDANQQFGGANNLASNNSATLIVASQWSVSYGATTVAFFTNMGGAGWTASGTKGIRSVVTYEF